MVPAILVIIMCIIIVHQTKIGELRSNIRELKNEILRLKTDI